MQIPRYGFSADPRPRLLRIANIGWLRRERRATEEYTTRGLFARLPRCLVRSSRFLATSPADSTLDAPRRCQSDGGPRNWLATASVYTGILQIVFGCTGLLVKPGTDYAEKSPENVE